jgi:hypothetical protein
MMKFPDWPLIILLILYPFFSILALTFISNRVNLLGTYHRNEKLGDRSKKLFKVYTVLATPLVLIIILGLGMDKIRTLLGINECIETELFVGIIGAYTFLFIARFASLVDMPSDRIKWARREKDKIKEKHELENNRKTLLDSVFAVYFIALLPILLIFVYHLLYEPQKDIGFKLNLSWDAVIILTALFFVLPVLISLVGETLLSYFKVPDAIQEEVVPEDR